MFTIQYLHVYFIDTNLPQLVYIGFSINTIRCYGRAVKAVDSKSTGVTRAGSSPAGTVFFYTSRPTLVYSYYYYLLREV